MRILIADDDAGIQKTLSDFFVDHHDVSLCNNGEDALKIITSSSIDLVITDQKMPGLTGLEVIKKGKLISPSTTFILLTAFGTVQQAVEAIQYGAEDYLMKPFDLTDLDHRINRIEKLQNYNVEKYLKSESLQGLDRFIGKSDHIIKTKIFINKIHSVSTPVLLLGPTGCGKEVISKAIHECGNRSNKPFVAINCASLSQNLMESELFGHEKGAFTGADKVKIGKFELANGGSIFLDEIGELSLDLQAKLLRVLQENEFYRIGGTKQIRTNARVLTATHRDLKKMVKEGAFREDLYFRLNVIAFEAHSLSKRKEDIPLLIDYFWKILSQDLNRCSILSTDALTQLMKYSYPGNIRELKNILERLIVLGPTSGEISLLQLPVEIQSNQHGIASISENTSELTLNILLEEGLPVITEKLENIMIHEAMSKANDNQIKAAEILKIKRGALQYKLKKIYYKKAA